MIRMVYIGKWFSIDIEDVEGDIDNINAFLDNGDVVVIAPDMETAAESLNLNLDEITAFDENDYE